MLSPDKLQIEVLGGPHDGMPGLSVFAKDRDLAISIYGVEGHRYTGRVTKAGSHIFAFPGCGGAVELTKGQGGPA